MASPASGQEGKLGTGASLGQVGRPAAGPQEDSGARPENSDFSLLPLCPPELPAPRSQVPVASSQVQGREPERPSWGGVPTPGPGSLKE